MEHVTREVREQQARLRAAGEPSILALWSGVLLAPLAVLGNIQAGYALAPRVCEGWPPIMSHISVALMLVLAVTGGLIAQRNWVATGRDWPEDLANPIQRSRFLGVIGMLLSALSVLVILGQWLGPLMLRPCQ